MTKQTSPDNWQLQEGGEIEEKWLLQESEQTVTTPWDLQESEAQFREWQPVEYEPPPRTGVSASRILPLVVLIALVAVVGYGAWVFIPRIFGTGEDTPSAQAPEGEAPMAQTSPAPGDDTPESPEDGGRSAEPGVTPEDQTPTPEQPPPAETPPEPAGSTQAVLQVDFATVINPYGVNARVAPNTDANIIRILEQGQTFLVLGTPVQGWLELFVNESQLAPGLPIVGQVGYAAAEFMQTSPQIIPEDFYNQILTVAGRATPTSVSVAPTTTVEVTAPSGLALPTVTPSPAPITSLVLLTSTTLTTGTAPISLTITISSPTGLNVRIRPSVDAPIVTLLVNQQTVPALGRLIDNQWVFVQMPDGSVGWVSIDYIVINGDINLLPPVLPELEQPETAEEATPTPAADAALPDPPPPYTGALATGLPGVRVPVNGVNARATPDTEGDLVEVVPAGAALVALARSADGQWIQVQLPDGDTAWIFRSVILPVGTLDSLPIGSASLGETPPVNSTTEVTTTTPVTAPATPQTTESTSAAEATARRLRVNIYQEPSTGSERLVSVGANTVLAATGRNAEGDWIQVVSSEDGAVGWVEASDVELNVDIESLEIVP
jgi:SH3-like domain-containing protein